MDYPATFTRLITSPAPQPRRSIAPATVTVADLSGLEASDQEFLKISELINRYGQHDLEQIRDIRALKDDRERVNAIGLYIARVIHSNTVKLEAQNNIAEVRLRQERRIGELLAEMQKHPGGRPTKNQSHDETSLPLTLANVGVSKSQSSRWQLEAKLPDSQFEDVVATAKENGVELTSYLVQTAARDYLKEKTGLPVRRFLTRNVEVEVALLDPSGFMVLTVPIIRTWGVAVGGHVMVTVYVDRIEDETD